MAASSNETTFFQTGDGPNVFRFNPRYADDIYAEFFGSSGAFQEGARGDSTSFEDIRGGPRKAPPIERALPCTLEELYKGATKKMKISREICDSKGRMLQVEEVLTIDIKPGWKKGTKITFPEKGNDRPNIIASDLVFTVDEKPHSLFTRDGNDLVYTQKISLAEALTGYTVHLKTLDGRNLTAPINTTIHPNYEEVVLREGMPIPKQPTKRGNLRIRFDVKYPTGLTRLTAEKKSLIKELLSP